MKKIKIITKDKTIILPFQIALSWVKGIQLYFGILYHQIAIISNDEFTFASGLRINKKFKKITICVQVNGINIIPILCISKKEITFTFLIFSIDIETN